MPFYEYQCKSCGHDLEAMQKISDPPLKKCPHCGKSQLRRLMSAPVFRLKGGGWYETDFKGYQDTKRNLADRPEADLRLRQGRRQGLGEGWRQGQGSQREGRQGHGWQAPASCRAIQGQAGQAAEKWPRRRIRIRQEARGAGRFGQEFGAHTPRTRQIGCEKADQETRAQGKTPDLADAFGLARAAPRP